MSSAVMTRPTPGPQVIVADLDRDGRVERVVLDPGRDPALAVWRGGRRLWQGVPRRWRPWKLQIADMEGDGRREIIVGVQKSTHFFPRPHHCLFIYRFDGQLLHRDMAVRPFRTGPGRHDRVATADAVAVDDAHGLDDDVGRQVGRLPGVRQVER